MEYFISNRELMDIKPSRGRFMWSKKILGPRNIISRLDRFLISNNMLKQHISLSSGILPWAGPDHKPITL